MTARCNGIVYTKPNLFSDLHSFQHFVIKEKMTSIATPIGIDTIGWSKAPHDQTLSISESLENATI